MAALRKDFCLCPMDDGIIFVFCAVYFQASENLGMAMVYTLATSAKEWLSELYGHGAQVGETEENDSAKDDVRLTDLLIYVLLYMVTMLLKTCLLVLL